MSPPVRPPRGSGPSQDARRSAAPAPTPGPILELEITDLARGGSGVARDPEGRAVFVPLTAPGDRVRARITREEKRFAHAELVEVLEPSPRRVAPRCAVFGLCGGCDWQHLPYDLQFRTKAKGVLEALSRAGVPWSGPVDELPAEDPWGYRNRVQLRGQGARLGFLGRGSRDLVPAARCEIAREELNAAWAATPGLAPEPGAPFKVELEILADGQVRRVWNEPHGALGFRQVNDRQNERLRAWVEQAVTPGGRLLDLFGGAGNLSLGLADRMASVDCVDSGAPRETPPSAPAGFRFHRASALAWLKGRAPSGGDKPLTVISDPPREGFGPEGEELIQRAMKLGAVEWIAVGCSPDGWARDLSRMVRLGWKVERLAVVDLFPQTTHVEAVARLRFN